MLKKTFLKMLNDAINRYLQLDPASIKRIKKLENKTILIHIKPINLSIYCVFKSGKLKLQTDPIDTVHTKISGTPLAFTAIMISQKNARKQFFSEDVTIEGDAELAQKTIELLDDLQIDWEEYLSKILGDVPTHHFSHFLKKAHKWIQSSHESMLQNINEYLHEEKQIFPNKEELQDFFEEVDEVRLGVDRIDARIQNLKDAHNLSN